MSNGVTRTSYNKDQKRQLRKGAAGLLVVLAIIAVVYFAGGAMEAATYKEQNVRGDLSKGSNSVEYNGQQYVYNEKLLTILFMGIDIADDNEEPTGYRNGGQADFIMLMIIDPDEKTIAQLHLDRDAMTEITILGVTGNVTGKRKAQLCLSHGFGDGKEQSCEFTMEAVEQLLNNIDIDFYIAMNMQAIPDLNDAVDGVTVLVEDDFSHIDPDMIPGQQLTLSGEQARLFVQNRMDIGDGTNEARMRRQQVFFSGFADKIEEGIIHDKEFVGMLFDIMEKSITTNMKRGRMINEANKAIDYERGTKLQLEGEHVEGKDGYVQFLVDEDSLQQLVINTFYRPYE